MSKAIRIHAHGGPEVMMWESVPTPEPGPAEALVHHTAVGLNFIDVYFRTGLYKIPHLPATLGMEAAGVVTAVGAEVTNVKPGDRVAYATGPIGAYATDRVIAADRLVKVPDGIEDTTAAAMMLQGMTAQYLLRTTHRVQAGETILVHAAAGGVGLILCQWAKHLGATVIGTVGEEAKVALAKANGYDHVLVARGDGAWVKQVRDLTGGDGVPVVYDSIGKDTFAGSLDCLATRGLMVSFGNSSGAVPPFDPGILSAKGSLYLTRPTLASYTRTHQELRETANDLFAVIASGAVKIAINQRFKLSEARAAHEALHSRATTGATVLIP